ncbi:MAG: four-helix bundle copper-binding protein [Gallionella sp.]|nr:four-helix bundle copper-binding protein [Gallionella sp.]MDD4958203.1 four-helix bundle copper-binding protein [Gallionella sp.]
MDRRSLLLSGVALAGAALVGRAQASEHEHSHHHDSPTHTSLATTAADCLQKGQVCLNHCLELLGQGEKEMATCAKSVNQMLALCGALQQLANQNSKQLSKLAAIALDACQQCQEECKKHADKHEACKACGESCEACAKECKKLVG